MARRLGGIVNNRPKVTFATLQRELAAEEAKRDAEGCRRAQAIAAQAPDDEEVEIGDIRRL